MPARERCHTIPQSVQAGSVGTSRGGADPSIPLSEADVALILDSCGILVPEVRLQVPSSDIPPAAEEPVGE